MGTLANLRNGKLREWIEELGIARRTRGMLCAEPKKAPAEEIPSTQSSGSVAEVEGAATIEDSGESPQEATAVTLVRKKLTEIYTKYAPQMMSVIEPMPSTYAGNEDELLEHVTTKYILGGG